MKTIWTAVSIIAIAHILAFLGFVGYLAGTGRIDRDRIDQVKAIFTPTIAAQQQTEADAKAKAEQARIEAEKKARLDIANPGVEARTNEFQTISQMTQEKIDRANRDLQSMQQFIDTKLADVEKREKDLDAREQAFKNEVNRVKKLQSDEQFQKTVTLMAAMKPQDLKSKLDVYLTENKTDLVVDILDALPSRNASKLLGLYQSQSDNVVAANLLLRLKDRGVGTEISGTQPNEQPATGNNSP